MTRWLLVIGLVLSLGVNLGLLAGRMLERRSPPAADSTSSSEERTPRLFRWAARELGLRGDDRTRFLERQRQFFVETVRARDRFIQLQSELRRELVAEAPDRQRVDDLLERIAEAHVDLERAFVDNLLDSREILNSEQEKRFMRFLQRLRQSRSEQRRLQETWRERRGRRSGRPGESESSPGATEPPPQ